MREDALYYTQRETAERDLAETTADPRVRAVHQSLADRYSEFAKRELSKLTDGNRSVH